MALAREALRRLVDGMRSDVMEGRFLDEGRLADDGYGGEVAILLVWRYRK